MIRSNACNTVITYGVIITYIIDILCATYATYSFEAAPGTTLTHSNTTITTNF